MLFKYENVIITMYLLTAGTLIAAGTLMAAGCFVTAGFLWQLVPCGIWYFEVAGIYTCTCRT